MLPDQSDFNDSLMDGAQTGLEAEDFQQFQQSQAESRARQQEAESLQQQVPQHRGLGLYTGGQTGAFQQQAEAPQTLQTQQVPQLHRGLQMGAQAGGLQHLHQGHQAQARQLTQQVPQHNLGLGGQVGGQQLHQAPHQPGGQGNSGLDHLPKQPAFDLADAPPDLMKQCWEMSTWLIDSGLPKKEATEKAMEWLRKQTLKRDLQHQQTQQGQAGLAPEVVQLLQGQDSVNRVLAENLTRNSENSLDPLAHT